MWHGTRETNPEEIWSSTDGLMINFANEGMWGRGLYFAVKASYSKNYAHLIEKENLIGMLLVKVLVGESVET